MGSQRESGIVRAMGELAKYCGVKIRVQAAFATGGGPSVGMAAQRHVHCSDTAAAIYSELKSQ